MNVVYEANGSQITSQSSYDIATGTAVAIGQVVKLAAGKVVLAVVGETGAILGVAFEDHPGVTDALNSRATGLKIKVLDAPDSVYECAAPQLTATGGSATTFVSTGYVGGADTDMAGGYIKLISKAATSTLTDSIGTVYGVTGSTAASGTFTCSGGITGNAKAGDVFAIFPPIGWKKGRLDTGISKLDLGASVALPFTVCNYDSDRNMIQFINQLHSFK